MASGESRGQGGGDGGRRRTVGGVVSSPMRMELKIREKSRCVIFPQITLFIISFVVNFTFQNSSKQLFCKNYSVV